MMDARAAAYGTGFLPVLKTGGELRKDRCPDFLNVSKNGGAKKES
jgi:hypothetical protein